VRFAIVVALVAACGGAQVAPVATHPTELRDLGWLVGAWHADSYDTRFVMTADALWGVQLNKLGFEIYLVERAAGRLEMLAITDDKPALTLPLISAAPNRVELGSGDRFVLERTADKLEVQYARDANVGRYFPAARVAEPKGAEVEAADLAFAADSAKRGADAWVDAMAADGALWRKKARVKREDMRAGVASMLAKGSLAWRPIASGERGDWGFTVGTYAYTPASGAPGTGSYCTIWRRVDGAWRVAFDLGT
jgi:hypothetical protein